MQGQDLDALVEEFLQKRRLAVWGVEDRRGDPSGWVVNKLRATGAEVVAVNPDFSSDTDPGRARSLGEIDPPAEAVLVYVDRQQAMQAVADCIEARTPLVWLHDALSQGAASAEAIDSLREAGCRVIPGLCPMLYLRPVDPAHFCLRWVLRLSGKEKKVRQAAAQPGAC